MNRLIERGDEHESDRVPAHREPLAYAPRPEPYYGEEVDLRDVWSVLRRRRWWIFGTLAAVICLVGAYTWWQIPVWRSSTLIRVEESDQSNVAVLDVLASLQRGSEIETEMRILRTRPIAEEVTDVLDLNFVVHKPAEIPRSVLFDALDFDRTTPPVDYEIRSAGAGRYAIDAVGEDAPPLHREFSPGDRVELPGGWFVLSDLERLGEPGEPPPRDIDLSTLGFQEAVRALDQSLQVTRPDREANVVQVAYEGTDRDLVMRIPNAVAAAFIDQGQEVQKTEVRSTVSFLEEQSKVVAAQLEAAENELQTFREGRQVVALGAEAEAQIERLAVLRTDRTQLDAERSSLQNLVDDINSDQRPDYRRLAAFPTFLENAAIADILQSLTAADRARTDLLARTTESHPDVQAIERQIDGLEEQLWNIGTHYLEALNDEIASLDAVLAQFGSELEEIPEKEVRFARLERQTTLLAELYTLLQTRLKEAEVAEAVEDATVRVVETAIMAEEPVSPRPMRNLALAGILGLMLGVGLGFVREYMDTRIHSSDNVEAMLGVAAIGRIPTLQMGSSRNGKSREGVLITHASGKSVGAEAYRTLRTNVRFVRGGAGATEMVVTSPGPKEGKSITAGNLATTFAHQGIRTVLVDADMRRAVQHHQFGVSREPGLSAALAGDVTLDEAIVDSHIEGLHLLPGGVSPPNPAELLGSLRMDELLAALRSRYEAIVIDSPPMLAVTDAAVLGPKVQGVILVVRAEQTEREASALALSQLRHVGATVLGVVINDAKASGSGYYYYRSYYGEDKPRSGIRKLLSSKG